MISIIIPAHNEAGSIKEGLLGLLPGIELGELEIIVVCNACTDRTADIVRTCHDQIDCVEVEKPSKVNALNVGDVRAHHFPRIYMDADVRVSYEDVLALADALRTGDKLAVSPQMKMDVSRSSWIVRAYYDIWSQLPYCCEGMMGVGVYALSQEGRSRFDLFPDLISDDGYVRLQFLPEERGAVGGIFSTVTAPSHLLGLIKIKTRSRLGEYELRQKYPDLFKNDGKDYANAMSHILRKWQQWPKVLVYILVNLMTRIRAKVFLLLRGYAVWERDESSRNSGS